jgi:hypothetical protein
VIGSFLYACFRKLKLHWSESNRSNALKS